MKRYKQFAVAGVALSTVGVLAGCGTVNTTTSGSTSTNTINQAGTWKTYTNDRFGFSVEYPSTWKTGPRSNDGDGRYFTTPSGMASFHNGYGLGVAKSDVMLVAVGTPNAVMGSGNGYNFKKMVAAFKGNIPNKRRQQRFISESYTVVPNKWIVDTLVTKLGYGGIQYSEMYISLNTNQTITMIFPESKSNVYLPIWNYVSKKFRPGNKSG
ncbi:hypothetical protein [Ferroacidibacillus organovorans]|uniref:PsbP C-terminal domain-containing protein n=1 Tax=Ferroacidibacillus organovorans TaxID=1765683 RepID=A0A853KFI8_9BACL|nr:hypothetical protein [Ferroacidibacillus organovorans]KYP81317.1 hypothetical protein AYJ22_00695 [Ferroacidibacillus organovorans]OAG95104.1 hypothetical protein AYW79_01295 [Ferroacidibacillus organovorans]